MKFIATRIPDVLIIEPAVFADDRGWFMESFNQVRFNAALAELGLPAPRPFVQDNHSCSKAGVLRGLHYQLPPHAQGKLVRVTKGAAFDVAVDIRTASATFGQWVPEGFAHGFVALEDDTHFLYKTTDVYAKDCERSIVWNDPDLGIEWPLGDKMPNLAPKDAQAPRLSGADKY